MASPDGWDVPTSVDVPLDSLLSDITSDDPTCETCGTPLMYSGRGRKPKFCDDHKRKTSTGTGTRKSTGVDTAMATLATAENGILIPLMLLSQTAATTWNAQLDDLRNRNRAILESQPDLCKRINSTGAKVGPGALVVSYMVAVAPVAAIAVSDIRSKKPAKSQPVPTSQPTQPKPDPFDIDAVAFGTPNGS